VKHRKTRALRITDWGLVAIGRSPVVEIPLLRIP